MIFYKETFESLIRKLIFEKIAQNLGQFWTKTSIFWIRNWVFTNKMIYWKFNSSISKSKRTFFFRTSCIEILWTDIRYYKLSLLEILFLVFDDEIREEVPEEIQKSGVRWEDQLTKADFSGWNQIPRFESSQVGSLTDGIKAPKWFKCARWGWPQMTLDEPRRVFH